MKHSLHGFSSAGIVAFAGMAIAATAALAYEHADPAPHSALAVAEQPVDPGIDFMITGPAGPSEQPIMRSEVSASDRADRPQRRRMHLE